MKKIDITFYERFKADILAGLKVITIRDHSESHFQASEILHVATYEQNEYFCDIKVLSITPTTLNELTEQQAKQENMTLKELKQVIKEIYPDQQQFYVIHFEVV